MRGARLDQPSPVGDACYLQVESPESYTSDSARRRKAVSKILARDEPGRMVLQPWSVRSCWKLVPNSDALLLAPRV